MEPKRRRNIKTRFTSLLSVVTSIISVVAGCKYVSVEPEIGEDAYSIEGDTVIVLLNKVPELSTVGGAATIVNDDLLSYLIIARVDEDTYVVASSRCTHRGKALAYEHEAKLFRCNRGKSKFKLDGTVVSGPAEKPLKLYSFVIEGDRLLINLSN